MIYRKLRKILKYKRCIKC